MSETMTDGRVRKISRTDIDEVYPDLERRAYGFVPEGAETHWTARALWDGGSTFFDILHDRQHAEGGLTERKRLAKWLNEVGLKRLAKEFRDKGFCGSTNDYLTYADDDFAILGSPNGSYGYAYLSAWPLPGLGLMWGMTVEEALEVVSEDEPDE